MAQTAPISLITYLSCIMSRLSYFNNDNFIDKYTRILNIKELSAQLTKIKNVSHNNIFNPSVSNLIPISLKANIINYKDFKEDAGLTTNDNMKYIIISTSNYSSVFLIADKRTNSIFISFRGTSSLKSGLSYVKLTSTLPFEPCAKTKDGYLLGVFKIVGDVFYTISEGIRFLSSQFLKLQNVKIISTGHSLGGGCAQIFSYLWIKRNPTSNICCTTFGAPRVMNGPLIEKYINLITKRKIHFERIITDGDPFAKLSPKTAGLPAARTYYHVDDYDEKLTKVALFCTNYKKTKKVICGLKNKTARAKIDVSNHGSYLGINYDKSAQGLTDLKKEIHRDKKSNTICRIIIGSSNAVNEPSKVVFFNLQVIKTPNRGFIKNITMKVSKKLLTDYKHQDIYMNTRIFNKLIKDSIPIETDDLNPLKTDTYSNIEELVNSSAPKKELICA